MTQAERRDPYWDNLKGILIFFVVFGHFLWDADIGPGIIHAAVSFIYMFHMPAFAFVSGRFGHGRAESAGSIVRFFLLFILLDVAMIAMWPAGSVLVPRAHAWYLLALCVWRLLTKRVHRFNWFPVACAVTAIAMGFVSDGGDILAVSRIIGFWPFYSLGYSTSEQDTHALAGRRRWLTCFGVGCVAVLLFAVMYIAYCPYMSDLILRPYQDIRGHWFRSGSYIFAACMLICVIAAAPRRRVRFLTDIGRYSLGIYVFHRPLAYLFLMLPEGVPPFVIIALSLACAIILCAAFGNRFIHKLIHRLIS